MASFNGPKLTNPIRTDVPETQEVLVALAKQDPTPISDIPVGAKRLYEASSGKWQWQLYNGTSWAPVPFLQHNVDQLDGYHAAITPTANTVAVRNASGVLEDSITGNAATATSATTLSQTLPVNKGGTGATTSEAARSNLGVPPTSHASTATTYGVGNATQYGHLKLSDAANSSSGVSGGVAATPAAVKAAKDAADAAQSAANNAQGSADAAMAKASTLATASAAGIVKPGTGMTVDAAGALNVSFDNTVTSTSTTQAATPAAVKQAYDKATEAVDKAGILKLFNSRLVIAESNAAWQPPVTGWARVTVIGGGGGGAGGHGASTTAQGGGGGGQGEHLVDYIYLKSDSPVKVVVGAGGTAGGINASGSDGGDTNFGTISAKGGGGGTPKRGGFGGGTSPSSVGLPGLRSYVVAGGSGQYITDFSPGGGWGATPFTFDNDKNAHPESPVGYGTGGYGGRGATNALSGSRTNGGVGVQGCVIVEYYDPAKEGK